MKSQIIEASAPSSILDQGKFDFYAVTENGISFKSGTTRDQWLGVVEQLTAMHENSGRLHFRAICILADALNFGEEKFGEDYAQAIDETRKWMQVSAKTIHNAMWVMRHVDSSRRRELLSLSHHEAVASLEPVEQDELLSLAEDQNLTTAELRRLVVERHPKTKRGKDRKTKAKASADPLAVNNMVDAKAAAVSLSNWLTENEDKITDAFRPLLEHFYKLYRRRWMSGHKK
jgi:hypothetical protein